MDRVRLQQSIRVVTSELPRILDGIVERLFAAAGDIRVLARTASRAELLEAIRLVQPDVVILGLGPAGATDIGWELFASDPMLRVLGIAGDGLEAFVYELRPRRTSLGQLAPADLVTLIRDAARARAAAGSGVSR